ncbi:MAG: hypothetical protein K5770_05405 [Lachnospiraceae bacterium]|nr:hypothetical protein [Lachnospiraceae bacterium]
MKNVLLTAGLFCAALVLSGCTVPDADLIAGQTGEQTADRTAGLTGEQTPDDTEEQTGGTVTGKKERTDDWKPSDTASVTEAEKLKLPPEEALAVKISLRDEEAKDIWDSYTGGADAEYAPAEIEGDAPEALKNIIDDYNMWVNETTKNELKAARERWERYHASDPDSFIALTPRIGMKLSRSDTSLISYVTVVNRYNREYEPDDNLYHGYTFDSQTGRRLFLNDLVTDIDRFAKIVCDELLVMYTGYADEKTGEFLEDGFRKAVTDSIKGARDDGLFAWTVSTEGFSVYLADPFYKEGYLMHDVEDIFIPFGALGDILCQELAAGYDHICYFYRAYLPQVYGMTIEELPQSPEYKWYATYKAVKDGQNYLYLSGDDQTLVYHMKESGAEYIGQIFGEIDSSISINYEPVIDPDRFTLKGSAFLVQELLNLCADACIGDNGVPELFGLFKLEYGGTTPLMVVNPFEAEVFPDEKASGAEKKELPEYTGLMFLRTDGDTFIDMEIDSYDDPELDGAVCRLYVTGNYQDGFTVNGHPQDEILEDQGWLEE